MGSTLHDDSVDDLLIQYLAALDVYQAAQARLAQALKEGYFDLARSKQALGPTRMSQSSYDLGETLARVQVTITPSPPQVSSIGRSDQIMTGAPLEWTLGPSPSALTPPRASSTAEELPSTLRQRSNKSVDDTQPSDISASTAPIASSSPSTISKSSLKESHTKARPLSRSPLLQFSAFPPPALRDAERGFGNAARAAVEIVMAQGAVVELEDRIAKARTAAVS